MNLLAKRIYDVLPAGFQNLLLTGFGVVLHRQRYTGGFHRFQELFEEAERWSLAELEAYQDERLREVVRHAYSTVPYYRRLFDHRGLHPRDFRSREDLQKLPVLTRQDIKANFNDLLSTDFDPRRIQIGHTSGTTGSPLEVGYDQGAIHATYAALDRHYRWAGLRMGWRGDRVAVVRGNVIVPLDRKTPPFWRHNRFQNQLLISSFHLSPSNLPSCFEAMRNFEPAALDGYPSTLYVLAKYLLNGGLTFPVRAVISSSETLYDFQREAIERAFECRVFDYYALAERVVFASECGAHGGRHLYDEFSVAEVLDAEGRPVPVGGSGRLVGTTLHNRAMPLLRYATNDMAALRPGICSCGLEHPLMEEVTTKAEDILTLRDGRLVSPSVLTHPFKPLTSIESSQIVQMDYDHVVVRLVPRSDFSERDGQSLRAALRERLGSDIRVDIEIRDEIPRSPSGKFKWVISKVSLGI